MSHNQDSVPTGQEFTASKPSTGRSSHNPHAGWDSHPSEVKHQPGRSTVPDNVVEILPKGTHLPPDRTFLPQNQERNVPASTRTDPVGTGMENDEIIDTLGGATSADVNKGYGMPGDSSQKEERTLGDGGHAKGGAGVAHYGSQGVQIGGQGSGKRYDPAKDYVGNSREEKEYRNSGGDKGPSKGNRGPGAATY